MKTLVQIYKILVSSLQGCKGINFRRSGNSKIRSRLHIWSTCNEFRKVASFEQSWFHVSQIWWILDKATNEKIVSFSSLIPIFNNFSIAEISNTFRNDSRSHDFHIILVAQISVYPPVYWIKRICRKNVNRLSDE